MKIHEENILTVLKKIKDGTPGYPTRGPQAGKLRVLIGGPPCQVSERGPAFQRIHLPTPPLPVDGSAVGNSPMPASRYPPPPTLTPPPALQGFSKANRNASEEDKTKKNVLLPVFLEVLAVLKWDYAVIENVCGLLSGGYCRRDVCSPCAAS